MKPIRGLLPKMAKPRATFRTIITQPAITQPAITQPAITQPAITQPAPHGVARAINRVTTTNTGFADQGDSSPSKQKT
jgi:hypothetical protein